MLARALLAFLFLTGFAGMGAAETYKGLTLGEPIPDHIMPVFSQSFANQLQSEVNPDQQWDLCQHRITGLEETGTLQAITDTCSGAILQVTAVVLTNSFFDPERAETPFETDVIGFTFKETTLEQTRRRFGSEGLVPYNENGQQAQFIPGLYNLTYHIADTASVVTFVFEIDGATGIFSSGSFADLPPIDAEMRDAAHLIGINLIQNAHFLRLNEGLSFRPSDGYTPIPNPFTGY